MRAPERFVDWIRNNVFEDRNQRLPPDLVIQYHARSSTHSTVLGEFLIEDLLDVCAPLREQAARGEVAYGIDHSHVWPNGKAKKLDLVVGIPQVPLGPPLGPRIHKLLSPTKPRQREAGTAPPKRPPRPRLRPVGVTVGSFSRVLLACEEKAQMTEHGKTQPRIFSELNDSHVIVHAGGRDTIAAAITTVNIAKTFISALRQAPGKPVEITQHDQPRVAAEMVQHLRGLKIRDRLDETGLDAYCTFVVDVDNQGHASLHTGPPAPQPGDPDHYETFLARIARRYADLYADVTRLLPVGGLSVEEALTRLAAVHPGMLRRAGALIAAQGVAGGAELQAILDALDLPPNDPEAISQEEDDAF